MFTDVKDTDVYDYRKSKEERYGTYMRELKRTDHSVKKSVRTALGYLDIYIYYPKELKTNIVYFNSHGGGMCLSNFELDMPYCQKICDAIGCIVVNVDYFVAPEYKFPKTYTSMYEMIKYCNEHRDEFAFGDAKFVIGGNSAGGQISAAVIQLEKQDHEDFIKGLVLNYAPCDQHIDQTKVIDQQKVISPSRIHQYQAWEYNDASEIEDPLSSIVNSDPRIYPPTLENTAELDSLRAGEEQFAEMLQKQGTYVDYKCYSGCQHGFTHQELHEYNAEASEDAWERIESFLKKIAKNEGRK